MASGKLTALFKQGLNEIPEVVLTGIVAAAFVSVAFVKVYRDDKKGMNGPNNSKYKFFPVYMRPDDPRAAYVHKS